MWEFENRRNVDISKSSIQTGNCWGCV